jgi:hypothetical protein
VARAHCSINALILATIAALCIGLVSACENTVRALERNAPVAQVTAPR